MYIDSPKCADICICYSKYSLIKKRRTKCMAGSYVAANPFSAFPMIHKPKLNETARDAIKALLSLVLKEELRRRTRSGMPIFPHLSFPLPFCFSKFLVDTTNYSATYTYLLCAAIGGKAAFNTLYKTFQNIIFKHQSWLSKVCSG